MRVYYAHSDADRGASVAGSCNRHLAAPLLTPLESRMYDISDRRLHQGNKRASCPVTLTVDNLC